MPLEGGSRCPFPLCLTVGSGAFLDAGWTLPKFDSKLLLGSLPSSDWLADVYMDEMRARREYMLLHLISLGAMILKMDHTFQITKYIRTASVSAVCTRVTPTPHPYAHALTPPPPARGPPGREGVQCSGDDHQRVRPGAGPVYV